MTGVLVGCPVAHREWIIRQWADAALRSCDKAELDVSFVLAAHPDDPTAAVLTRHLGSTAAVTVVPVDEERLEDRRQWKPARYRTMVEIRNAMLGHVRAAGPDLFLSLDSDILLRPNAVATMVPLLEEYDAVGSACFLSRPPGRRVDGVIGRPGWNRPNYGMLGPGDRIMRSWQPDMTRRVDILMAIKLMTPAAYAVDYRFSEQGEDVGWGVACKEAGVRLGWTSKVVSKHVMDSRCRVHARHDPSCEGCVEPLLRPDPRCGY